MPPDMIEGMRKAYKECESFLNTATQPLKQSNIIKEAKIEALKSMTKNFFEIDLVDVKVIREKQLRRELNKDKRTRIL